MRELSEVADFGSVEAMLIPLLDTCFEDHEAYLRAQDHSKFLILGRKGSGKTAIYRKLLGEKAHDRFLLWTRLH